MKRKWGLAVVLALVCVMLLCMGVAADTVAEGTCGDDLTWVLDDAGVLTISGSGAFVGYEYYTDAPWYKYANQIETVSMTDSIRTIGQDTFRECTKLTTIELSPNLIKIGDNAFFNCTSLSSIDLPDGLCALGNYTFCGCIGLSELALPDSVYQIGEGAFYGCTSLESVILPDSLEVISNEAFRNCRSLSHITFPSHLTTIWSNAFMNCYSLTQLSFPDSLRTLGKSVFKGCKQLQTVYLNEGLEVLSEHTFANCTSLTEVYFSNTVTTIGSHAFQSCYKLSNIVLPESLEHIGRYAFMYCNTLTSLVLPENVTYLAWTAFAGSGITELTLSNDAQINYNTLANTEQLTTLNFTNDIQYIDPNIFQLYSISAYNVQDTDKNGYCSKNGVLYTYDSYLEAYTLLRYPASKTEKTYCVMSGTETIGAYAFLNCALTMIDLSNCVTKIEEGAFQNCYNLSTLCVDRLECTIETDAFADTSLECLQCGNIDRYVEDSPYIELLPVQNYSVKDTNGMGYRDIDGVLFFYDDSTGTLTLVQYPHGRTDTQYIVEDGTNTIGKNAFAGVASLKSIALPSSVHVIENTAFQNCTSLKSIHFPTVMKSIGSYAFYHCNALESVSLPQTLSELGSCAFSDCTSLQSCTLPSNLKCLPFHIFYNCRYLKEIIIPKTVDTIENGCFANCTALRRITFLGDVPNALAKDAFSNTHSTFTIYYIEGKSGWTSPTWNGYNTATFVPEGYSLTPKSTSTYTFTDATITNVPAGTTVSTFVEQFDNTGVSLTTATGTSLSDTALVGTGCVVRLTVDGTVVDSRTIIVTGDMDGDGLTSATDLTILQQYYRGYAVTIAYPAAADLNGDGKMTRADAMVLARQLAGWTYALTPQDDIIVIG